MNDIEQLLLPILLVEKGLIRSCNQVFTEQVGYNEMEIVGRELQEIITLSEQSNEAGGSLDALLARVGLSNQISLISATVTNNYFYDMPIQLHCQAIEGRSDSFRVCFRILENKSIDPITTLPNGWAISSRSKHLLKNQDDRKNNFVLIFFNVDNFSTINFRYGFDIGDDYLQVIAKKLQSVVENDNLVVRFNNAKFGILVENHACLSTEKFNTHIRNICQRLCQISEEPLKLLRGVEVCKSFSIGVSEQSIHYNNFHAIEIAGETAMLQAKKYSESKYHFSTSQTLVDMLSHKLIIDALPSAIEQNKIQIYYQPQYEIKSDKLIGFEALSRWHHEALGNITPDVFVGIAEEIGLHFDFDLWVFRQVCSQIVTWRKQGLQIPKIAINISFKTLEMTTFVDRLKTVIEQTQCPTEFVELEITETASAKNLASLNNNIVRVKELGISIAIDDFGAGYSSLSMIREFHASLDKLKLDRSLIRNICNTEVDREFTRQIIKLSQVLDVHILAEGVEDKEQKDMLHSLDCDQAQGYYFAKPMTKSGAEQLIKEITN
ncbi:putative bifunctional diguanylate cyclase/phosphodiesterase [Vibrio algarum]|uniref:Bifunctional diguanylate cyclase/phosphodiesterase n=1 Tax=Vibrio algarum TaxID=3020714 RepID=A0ABT4YTX2_9VIBR|nr:bifunctional diguanylate cyclase/phosphodiesterase [Vibrio sp. KJ40-1]MDB1124983.1 bifunctional diguanylate cyclase/phosphodiesterase [Vibrio sp. KJ40-1]